MNAEKPASSPSPEPTPNPAHEAVWEAAGDAARSAAWVRAGGPRKLSRHTEVLYRVPMGDDMVWINAHSDGMSGWVEVLDLQTDELHNVSWSVTSEVDSQSAALEEAIHSVDALREDRRVSADPYNREPEEDR